MKGKLKGGGVKGLVLEHGEKAVFGAGVLCFLLFAYSLLGRETLPPEKQPNKLVEAATEAKNSMEASPWDAVREGIAVVSYKTRARRDDVVSANYALSVPFDRPPKIPKLKRDDPKLFAVSDLRVAAGMGAFVLRSEKAAAAPPPAEAAHAKPKGKGKEKEKKPNPLEDDKPAATSSDRRPIDIDLPYDVGVAEIKGDAKLSRQTWAVVTALVPYKKQIGEFERVFKDSIPVLENGGNPANREAEKMRDVPVYAGPQIERAEIVEGDPAAQPKWEAMTFRGYAKFRNQWAIVSPDIVGQDYTDPVYTMPLGPLKAAEWDDSVGHEPEIPLAAKEELEQNAQAVKEAGPAEPHENPSGAIGFGAPPEDPTKAPPRPAAAAKRVERKVVEYRLLRFFDFDVEEGKTYQYRVRLVMNNPNYGLADKFLKNVDSKREKLRETPWSAASPPATVRAPDDIFFAGVQPSHGIKDTAIKVKLMTLDPEMGVPAVVEEEVPRGTVLNIHKNVEVADLIGKNFLKHEVNFDTEALLLDIRGGRSFSPRDKTLTEPGEALFVSRSGKLIAHSELDDLEQWEYYPTPGGEKKPEKGGKLDKDKTKKDPNAALDDKPLKKKKRRRS